MWQSDWSHKIDKNLQITHMHTHPCTHTHTHKDVPSQICSTHTDTHMHKQVLAPKTRFDPKVKILNIHEKRKTKSETRMEDGGAATCSSTNRHPSWFPGGAAGSSSEGPLWLLHPTSDILDPDGYLHTSQPRSLLLHFLPLSLFKSKLRFHNCPTWDS